MNLSFTISGEEGNWDGLSLVLEGSLPFEESLLTPKAITTLSKLSPKSKKRNVFSSLSNMETKTIIFTQQHEDSIHVTTNLDTQRVQTQLNAI